MDLFEKIKLIIETQGYTPFDIGNKTPISTGLFLTPNGALSLHLTSLNVPNEHELILPEDTFVYDAKFSPDDSWLVLPIDYSGKESHNLFRIPISSSKRPLHLEKLSKQPGRTLFLDWSPDGKKIAWAVSRQQTNQVVIQPNDTGKDESILWSSEEIVFIIQWEHPDYLKLTKVNGRTNEFHDVVIGPKTGEIILTLPVAALNYYMGRWNPKKPIFPFVNSDDGRLSLYNMESNELLTLPVIKGELEGTAWDSAGDRLFVSATVDARDIIYSIDIESKKIDVLPLPLGINKIVDTRKWDSEEMLFFIHADATTRMNLWRCGLESREIKQLTKKRSPKIGTDEFPLVNSISEHWKSRDGLEIHGFIMVPHNPPPPEGYPALVSVHGGPRGQEIDAFVGWYQILVQEGFVVFRPNFRGSTGYGAEFQRANFREIGKADLLDIVTGIEYLVRKYRVNPKKVAITGGSYGGYMTLRALTKPDVFDFASGWAEAAISDFQYQYDTGDAVFRDYIRLLFGPLEEKETKSIIEEASPITSWEKVCKPLGVVQFANDTRTPLKPVWDFVQHLIERGDSVEFHVEPVMGHANIPKGYLTRSIARKIQFLQKTLLD